MINDISNVNKSFGFSLKEISRQTGFEINAVSGRVNELKKDDLVKECTKRRCRITGRLITPVTFNQYSLEAREPITGPVSPKQGSVHRTKAKEYVRLPKIKEEI